MINFIDQDAYWNDCLSKIMDIIYAVDRNIALETFCVAPYLTLDYDQSGSMQSCYIGKEKLGNWKQLSAVEEFNNKNFQDLRYFQKTGQQDKSLANCHICYDSENIGVSSTRLRELVNAYVVLGHDNFKSMIKKIVEGNFHGNFEDIIKTEMRSSNFCNLQCLHCDHNSSTQWLNFYSKDENYELGVDIGIINGGKHTLQTFFSDHKHYYSNDTILNDDVIKSMIDSKIIHFSGGEPLIDPNQIKWLEHLSQNNSVNQTIWYHTNLNVTDIEKFFPYWQNFKSVRIIVSVDCPPSTYSFFRRKGNFELMKNNIDKINAYFNSKTVKVDCRITFNFFAALRWQEITDTWVENNWAMHSSIVFEGPASSQYLPDKLKFKCIDKIQENIDSIDEHKSYSNKNKDDYKDYVGKCLTYLKSTPQQGEVLNPVVCKFLKMMDKNDKIQTLDFYPELERYYNKTND